MICPPAKRDCSGCVCAMHREDEENPGRSLCGVAMANAMRQVSNIPCPACDTVRAARNRKQFFRGSR
jgi:hypothetical protein